MNAYTLLEPLLVGLIIAASLWMSLRRFMPRQLAAFSDFARKTGWMPALWRLLAPPPPQAACSSGCSNCSSCETPPAVADTKFIVVHPAKRIKAQ